VPYTEHPVFDPPPGDAPLWRYMDFTKFVSLIHTRALYFARADTLGDPFEGAFTRANLAFRPYWAEREGLPVDFFDGLAESRRLMPLALFVNSWHWNEVESAAMWSLYLRSGEGIAIRSTFTNLCDSLQGEDSLVFAGQVRYTDYDSVKDVPSDSPEHDSTLIPEDNALAPFVHKRRSYEHEREVRVVVWRPQYFENVRARRRPEWRELALAAREIEDTPR
jgi:hypothetical protein